MQRISKQNGWKMLWRQGLLAALLTGFTGFEFGFASPYGSAAQPGNTPETVNYGRPFESPTRPAFIPLPPGAVEPQGWLRDWCETARDGYTGHSDEYHEDFRKAWALDYKMTGNKLAHWWEGSWPYEGGGYWLDGMVRLGYALHDDFLINKAKSRLDVVVSNMHEDSILFMWWLNKNHPEDMDMAARPEGGEAQEWPIWTNGFMGRTLAAYYAATGNRRVLRALEWAYSGDRSLLRKGFALSNPWPAFETYTWTGNEEIKAALNELFANEIQMAASNKTVKLYESWYNRMPNEKLPWYRQPDHTVHFNESAVPWAVGYLWTGNREFYQAICQWYEIIERGDDGMQPHGVPVGDENSGPTGSFRGTETCNVSSYMWSQIMLLRIGGEGKMADRVERAFFNAAPAQVTRDFKAHVYQQTPNRLSKKLPGGGPLIYQNIHWPLCCTASLNRALPYYVMHMWMATYDNGLAATHYGPCKTSALVADRVPVELVCRTDYPFNDFVDVAVKPDREATFPLYFRIPGWCAQPEITLNGSACTATAGANGFVRIERLWQKGDNLRLRFPMAVCVKMGHDNNAKDTPYATVSYGPLLFSLPIPDTTDANTPDETSKWNYALDVTGEFPSADISVERQPMPAKWTWPLESPLKLHVHARSFDWKPETRKALPAEPVAQGEASAFQPDRIVTMLPTEPVKEGAAPEDIALVPYGCTKLRISMFPVTEQAFKKLQPAGN